MPTDTETEDPAADEGSRSVTDQVELRQLMEFAVQKAVMKAPDALVPVSGDALPDDAMLAKIVRDKAVASGVGKQLSGDDDFEIGNYVVVIDVDRLDEVPEVLLVEDSRKAYLRDAEWEVHIDALTGVSQEAGELVRENLVEQGDCYDADTGEIRPGYHDPRSGDAVIGENKPFVVVNST